MLWWGSFREMSYSLTFHPDRAEAPVFLYLQVLKSSPFNKNQCEFKKLVVTYLDADLLTRSTCGKGGLCFRGKPRAYTWKLSPNLSEEGREQLCVNTNWGVGARTETDCFDQTLYSLLESQIHLEAQLARNFSYPCVHQQNASGARDHLTEGSLGSAV